MENQILKVSELIAYINQTLDYAYPTVVVEGEVASFKTNQNKYVFFDLKDSESSVNCFMTIWQLRQPIADGMKVIVTGSPRLTKFGKFSLTVRSIKPVGDGSIKKSFDLLKEKLTKEGLFSLERKRAVPKLLNHIGVISSTQAAGYKDFIKILNDRWGGLKIDVAHVQVQGEGSADQIIQAIKYFNELEITPQVIAIIRGGGSQDDLSTFNDEPLVRAIAASRVPTIVGVGHEVDTSLADLAADIRAATPTNAAEILVPSKVDLLKLIGVKTNYVYERIIQTVDDQVKLIIQTKQAAIDQINNRVSDYDSRLSAYKLVIDQLNPERVLKKGYAIIKGEVRVGNVIKIETFDKYIEAEVKKYEKR